MVVFFFLCHYDFYFDQIVIPVKAYGLTIPSMHVKNMS